MRNILFLALCCLALSGCDKNKVFEKHHEIALLQWGKANKAVFEVDVQDIESPMDVIVELRHSAGITYGDISLAVRWKLPSGKESGENYVIPIRDRKTGNLLGSAMGDMCDTQSVIMQGFKFPETGRYVYEISHTMKEDVIQILEVGLIVRKNIQK
jgi:gliding motility-associated lipoprotein GldH